MIELSEDFKNKVAKMKKEELIKESVGMLIEIHDLERRLAKLRAEYEYVDEKAKKLYVKDQANKRKSAI